MSDPFASHPPPRGLKRAGVIAVCVALAVAVGGVLLRAREGRALQTWTRQQAIPSVALADVKGAGVQALTLPGNVQAFASAPIYARTSGYLKRWYVDIGGPVKAGQLLAELDTPDLDQQVVQARADLATAQANEALARTTNGRWAVLVAKGFVSKQAADEKAGDLAAKTSAVNSARANLNRLVALEGFKRITAPFDGIVTTRTTDVGALISVGGTGGQALFTVADQRRLRIYVNVPQSYSGQVRRGMTADVTVPEFPGRTFTAVLANDAQAINGGAGTMLVELQLDNAQGQLKPGSYAQVSFRLPSAATQTNVPATALLFGHDGPVVALVRPDSHVVLQPVTILHDLGPSVEISAGLAPGARVIDNPPEALRTGDLVRVVPAASAG
jgi:RND family efflux transporter MFP subunit